jgi:hypothetical protein
LAFNNASFEYFGVRSRFFRKDGKFFVETDGPNGKLATFEVKHTFGLDPLQQYLIEFPDGRLQALSLAWDSRPKEQGGQRWFHLYPNEEIRHDDPLHWTKLSQNWNFMCAECHSTAVRKNYDASSGDTIPRPAMRSATSRRRSFARKSRPADFATRAAANFPKLGFPGDGSLTPTRSRRLPAASIMPTDRCAMGRRSTTTARSNRARCLLPALPAAIAMSRTPPSCDFPATASACNATRAKNTRRQRTTTTKAQNRRLPVYPVTCLPAHTWSSTGGMITASVSHDQISR